MSFLFWLAPQRMWEEGTEETSWGVGTTEASAETWGQARLHQQLSALLHLRSAEPDPGAGVSMGRHSLS